MKILMTIILLGPVVLAALSLLAMVIGPCGTRVIKQKRGWVIQDKYLFLFWSRRCKITGVAPVNCPDIFKLKDLFFNSQEKAQLYLASKNHVLIC